MPTLTRDEVVDAIANGRIGALSIDTTVFDSKQKNFRQAEFRTLAQFKHRKCPVVITDVIAREMMSHLEVEAAETQRALKTALRSHNIRWHREQPAKEPEALLLNRNSAEFAQSEFDDFVAHVGVKILAVAETENGLKELFRRYFAVETPFGKREARKQEFPDAAALLRLEAYAKERKSIVLCIAQDKAWTDFADKSEHLVAVYPLNAALGMLSEAYKDQDLADEIVELWQAGGQEDFEQQVRDAIVDRLSYVDFDVDAESGLRFEAEPMEAELLEVLTATLTEPVVLATDDDTVTFSIDVDITGKFNAVFSFEVYDSVDKDYVSMGSESVDATDQVTLSLTIVADRDVSHGIQLQEISVSQQQFSVDFGYVDAFPPQEHDDNRY